MVLSQHQLQGLLGIAVVLRKGLSWREVRRRDGTTLKLNHADDAVVDDADELGFDAFVDGSKAVDLQATDALGLDIDLIGERLRAQDAPRCSVVMELLLEELPTATE